MSDGREDVRLREVVIKVRHLLADANALPSHVAMIQANITRLDYSYGEPRDLCQLDDLIEKFHEVELGLMEMAQRLER